MEDLIEYSSTHALNINSITRFFELIIFLVLGYYPESPLSLSEQKQLNNPKTETHAINKCLSNMREGDYYKLCTIEKENGVIAGGHSMLIYKSSNDKFTFFDPSKGATMNLDLATITDKIKTEEGEIAIMDNKKFLSKHHSKTIDKFKQFMLKKGLQPQEFTKRERAYSTTSSDSFGI